MKHTFFVIALVLLSATTVLAADKVQKTAAPAAQQAQVAQKVPAPAPAPQQEESSVPFCMVRGLCNVCTGWLELPRCIVYDNGFIPVFGLIVGIPEGAILTVARTCSGVFDIISLGMGGDTFHGKRFPHTVFNAHWVYERPKN